MRMTFVEYQPPFSVPTININEWGINGEWGISGGYDREINDPPL